MTDRKPYKRRIARRSSGCDEARREQQASPTPYLAELRRRAAARLRELSLALEKLRQEYETAAAECERLQAPSPAETPNAGAVARDGRGPEASTPSVDPDEIEHLVSRVGALAEKLSQAEQALASEREQRREAEQTVEELGRRLTASDERLMAELARVTALTERTRELEARLKSVQSRAADRHEGSMQAARGRLSDLEADVRSTRAVSAHLRAEMTHLLTFLDELNEILAAAAR